ncbi:MAG: ribonuclease HII [Bacteroidetes bacterium 4484_276]|nr:MAG: ribonuclease HII [Bacteroidetes bacterium 4484_276]
MLRKYYSKNKIEAGCDEAGRGCLAGPVFAAAVILPKDFRNEMLDDSKKLKEKDRDALRPIIENEALAWAVASVDHQKIDEINILNASFLAMHLALEKLSVTPGLLLIDGNRFTPYKSIQHHCIIKGDGKFMSIAAASILAKTHRDEYMKAIGEKYPQYNWKQNKGYPTAAHRKAISENGITPFHRLSFNLNEQTRLVFGVSNP